MPSSVSTMRATRKHRFRLTSPQILAKPPGSSCDLMTRTIRRARPQRPKPSLSPIRSSSRLRSRGQSSNPSPSPNPSPYRPRSVSRPNCSMAWQVSAVSTAEALRSPRKNRATRSSRSTSRAPAMPSSQSKNRNQNRISPRNHNTSKPRRRRRPCQWRDRCRTNYPAFAPWPKTPGRRRSAAISPSIRGSARPMISRSMPRTSRRIIFAWSKRRASRSSFDRR